MATEPLASLRDVTFSPAPHPPSPPQPRGVAPTAVHHGADVAFELRVHSFSLAPRELVACVGPSGSGKTTLLNIIAGILLPRTGRVRLMGRDLASQPDAHRRRLRLAHLGLVFQEFELLDYLSAWHNITLATRLGDFDATALARRARELAVAAGIHHALGRKPGCLSQGERQRVAICRALAHNPALVLCDEPTGNLDPDAASAVIDLLLDQVRSRDAGLLMVTHNHALLRHFDRVVHIRSSREPDRRLACLHEGAP